jgi:hypothetical protein
MKQLGAIIGIARFSVTLGVFWHLWGVWGFWWGLLIGLFWEVWLGVKVLAPMVLRAAGAP